MQMVETRMTDERRQLFLWVADGNGSVLPLLEYCNRLSYCDGILKWFRANGIRGTRFLEFYRENQMDILETYKEVIRRIKRNPHTIPIYFGKDFF